MIARYFSYSCYILQVVVMVYLQPDEKNQDIFRDGFEFTMGANSSNPEESSFNEEVSFISNQT